MPLEASANVLQASEISLLSAPWARSKASEIVSPGVNIPVIYKHTAGQQLHECLTLDMSHKPHLMSAEC